MIFLPFVQARARAPASFLEQPRSSSCRRVQSACSTRAAAAPSAVLLRPFLQCCVRVFKRSVVSLSPVLPWALPARAGGLQEQPPVPGPSTLHPPLSLLFFSSAFSRSQLSRAPRQSEALSPLSLPPLPFPPGHRPRPRHRLAPRAGSGGYPRVLLRGGWTHPSYPAAYPATCPAGRGRLFPLSAAACWVCASVDRQNILAENETRS